MTERSRDYGPSGDPDFFAALETVFSQYPEAADRYAIVRSDRLKDPRGGGGLRTGTAREIDGKLVVEFVAKPEQPSPGASHCFLWGIDPKTGSLFCVVEWEEIL